MTILLIIIIAFVFLYLGVSHGARTFNDSISLGDVAPNDFMSISLGGGCSGSGGFTSQFRTKCQPHGTPSVCSKDHDYTKGDFVCDSNYSCSNGFGHQSICQRQLAGLCSVDTGGKPAIAPQYADKLVSETTTLNGKTCNYKVEDICGTMDSYNFIRNFPFTRDGGGVSATDMDKCTAHFCQQPVEVGSCNVDPETGEPFEKCSKFRATGDEGNFCRIWLNSQDEITQRTAIQEYCLNHPDSGDCKCISRTSDPIYNDVVDSLVANPINDGCWWKPCKNSDVYLVTPDLANPTCPENICQSIINVVDVENDVDINNIQQNIQCDFEVKCEADQYKDETGACQPCTVCDPTHQKEILPCLIGQNRTCIDDPETCGTDRWSETGSYYEEDCKDCSTCKDGERVKSVCTKDSDTVCEVIPTSCPEGKFAPKGEDGNFDVCVNCSSCLDTQLVKTPCTQISDVVCRDKEIPEPDSSSEFVRDIVIGVSVVATLLIVSYGSYEGFKYYKRSRPSK